jgi:phytoene dehydrogenase-like protein
VFSVDLDATCASIAAACGPEDAAAYREFVAVWGRRSRAVVASFARPPSPLNLARSFWPLGAPSAGRPRTPGGDLAVDFLGSGDALLDRWFGSERLKAALAWFGAQSGPPMSEPGTAAMVGWAALLHDVPPGHPAGGSGGLTQALRRRLEADGGRVVLGDGAARILVADDGGSPRVTGVETRSGRRIGTAAVVAACHVTATRDLVGPAAPPALAHADPPLGNGFGLVLRALTDAPPRYPGADVSESSQGLQLLCTDRAQLAAAHGDWLGGRLPREPVPLAMCFSASDDTLAPPGQHVVTVWGQWYPYDLADGADWDAIADDAARRLVDAVDRYAPGFAGSVQRLHVQTPVALERELSLPRGNVMHVEMGLASMFGLRPTPALSGYRVPGLAGLYLAGASTHPGGGVGGNSGRSAARVLLADERPFRRARRAAGQAVRTVRARRSRS